MMTYSDYWKVKKCITNSYIGISRIQSFVQRNHGYLLIIGIGSNDIA